MQIPLCAWHFIPHLLRSVQIPLCAWHFIGTLSRICFALGRIGEARDWLGKALEIGGKELKVRALDDEDLAAVW